jgi:hypothetical protein
MMRWLASALIGVVLLLSFVDTASADPVPPVVVVDIQGDVDDPDGLRTAIGRELRATAVLPDDPRAASARGTLTIEARGDDRRITATYRSFGTPVARTVDLPSDPKRVQSVAVLLAGNVAREEADELLNGLKKKRPPAEPEGAQADADLARMRTLLHQLGDDERAILRWLGGVNLVEGVLSGSIGVLYLTREGERREHVRDAGGLLLVHGIANVVGGILFLASPVGEISHVELARDLEKEAKTEASADVIRSTEKRWAKAAEDARRIRTSAGGLTVVLGGLTMAVGLLLPAISSPARHGEYMDNASLTLVAAGGLMAALGGARLASRSDLETSWLTYQATKRGGDTPSAARAPTGRPSVGFAPTNGGASLSFGFTF